MNGQCVGQRPRELLVREIDGKPLRSPGAIEIATCIAFALAGAGTRFALVDVQTRLQIAVFWAVAVAVAFTHGRWWRSRRWTIALIANGAAATAAIVATRIALEGLPRPLLHLLRHIHG